MAPVPLMARRRFRPIQIDWKRSAVAWGYAYTDEHRIELEPSLLKDDKKLLEVAAHEVVHIILPQLDEATVLLLGRHIGDVLHRLSFRRS